MGSSASPSRWGKMFAERASGAWEDALDCRGFEAGWRYDLTHLMSGIVFFRNVH